jgi:hypothetical protein
MSRPELSVKAEALGLIRDIDPEWSEYLSTAIELTVANKIALDWTSARPLPKQLRNPSCLAKTKEGAILYLSTQVWLAIDAAGDKQLITPEETSGVLIEDSTGKIIQNFTGLPEVVPENTKHLIRISIRSDMNEETKQRQPETKWTLYSELSV